MITHEKHLAQFLFTLNTINSSYHQFFINIVNYGTELSPPYPAPKISDAGGNGEGYRGATS